MARGLRLTLAIAFLAGGGLGLLAATLVLLDGSVAPGVVLAVCALVLLVASRANWRDAFADRGEPS